ncbi:unnamed protein product [Moneuplotes crassus]|uniref:Uncharacterized protein n=1 Tax=Euplotes crassus TaxID=5936 RepID=A0AAD1UM15_EUPCR|nr:unnamed protein product [Moneuplotes crassus]
MDRKQFIHKLSKKQIKIEKNGAGLITPSINGSLISAKRRRSPSKKSRYSQKASSFGKEARENCENQNPNDPLDPSNYQSKKSEFYWKLHDLTLKIKDYVSNFKPAVKKNPIEEIINQARKRGRLPRTVGVHPSILLC